MSCRLSVFLPPTPQEPPTLPQEMSPEPESSLSGECEGGGGSRKYTGKRNRGQESRGSHHTEIQGSWILLPFPVLSL